ncbi:MAG: tyrosine--tRNA ligase [Parachlamydiales bacterium]|nr:tyrosine--tRNA ligase [Parachlamydiales bacterium]
MSNVIEVLQARGFINAISSEDVKELVNKPTKIYVGFDPTADSLHLGNLVPIIGMMWFQKFGHTPVAVVGGATGMIGDPSGKSQERNLLTQESVNQNLKGISANLESLLDFKAPNNAALIVNNADWMNKFTVLDFLRDIGKHFRMGPMLSKESVKNRLESDEGMSFTEFSYQILQSYDFLHLYDHNQVTIQMGGSDQWGNITAGVEFVRKMRGSQVFAITFPLLTRSDGKKFGKSEEGAIWLSPEKLSPYSFYQYFIRMPDADVIPLMRMLTFLPLEEINEIEKQMHSKDYVANDAQRRLAKEMTLIVHGQEALDKALKVTEGAAPGSKTILDAQTLETIANLMPNCLLEKSEVVDCSLVELLIKTGFASSKGESRRLIAGGGIYINNEKESREDRVIVAQDIIEGRFLLLGLGKKNKKLIRFN